VVGGKFAGEAPGLLENRKSESTGGVTGVVSTTNCTVLEGRESVCPPTVHSAIAVLLIVCGAPCANAGRLEAGRSIPAASTPALLTNILVNVFIIEKGDGGSPARRPIFS
jgi:hypothetical protein